MRKRVLCFSAFVLSDHDGYDINGRWWQFGGLPWRCAYTEDVRESSECARSYRT